MNIYLTHEEYQDMGGLLEQAAFARWQAQAAAFLDRVTRRRLQTMQTIPGEAKRLMFELIAVAASVDPLNPETGLTQETEIVDGVHSSRIYSQGRISGAPDQMNRMAAAYLDGMTDDTGVPLLYMGVGE